MVSTTNPYHNMISRAVAERFLSVLFVLCSEDAQEDWMDAIAEELKKKRNVSSAKPPKVSRKRVVLGLLWAYFG